MPGTPPLVFTNHDKVNNQIASQIIHGSFYNTLNYVTHGSETTSAPHEGQKETDDDLLASLAFPQMFDRRSTIERAHPSTCGWVFNLTDFKAWKAALRGLLWIKGNPGAGKSTLMSFIYAELTTSRRDPNGVYLDFFFNGRGNELQKTPAGMFRALINQIFVQNTNSRPLIREAFHEKRSAFGSNLAPWQWQEEELENIFFDAVMSTMQDIPTTIFIDALDEAGDLKAQKLARFFHKLNDSAASTLQDIKICISCRHYPFVSRIQAAEISVEIHNASDIALFVRDRLNIKSLENEENYAEWQKIERDLIKRAGGIFQWANLVVIEVERSILQGHSPRQIQRWLAQVPQQLSAVYKQILRDQIDDRFRGHTTLLFTIICYARRSLRLSEIRFALAAWDAAVGNEIIQCHETPDFIESDNVMNQRVKALSGGLLEVLHDGVQVIHQSVQDFLTTDGFEYLFDLQDQVAVDTESPFVASCDLAPQERCHLMLHRCCVVYLAAIDPKLNLDFGFDRQGLLSYLPLIGYAISNLFVHAQYALSVKYKDINLYISRLKEVFPRWKFAFRYLSRWSSQCPGPDSTLLHVASSHGLQYICQYLINQGDGLDQSDGYGRTPLLLAAQSGSLHLVQMLVNAGANIHARDIDGLTILHILLLNNHIKVATWFFEHDASVFGTEELMDIFPMAASHGDVEFLRRLIEQSNKLQHAQKKEVFETALYRAVSRGRTSTIEPFLPVIKAFTSGQKILDQALIRVARAGYEKVVQYLIIAGADVGAQHEGGQNAFEAAAMSGRHNIVQILLPHLALKSKYHNLASALRYASLHRHEKTVKLLLAVEGVVYSETTIRDAVEAGKSSVAESKRVERLYSGTNAPRKRLRIKASGNYSSSTEPEDVWNLILEMLLEAGASGMKQNQPLITIDPAVSAP